MDAVEELLSHMYEVELRLRQHLPSTKRWFYEPLKERLSQSRAGVALYGLRGSGKTILMLQLLPEGSYIKADHWAVEEVGLYRLVERLYRKGKRLVGIDEVNSYSRWREELKALYDDFPDLKLLITTSSSLTLWRGTASLSRRFVPFYLPPLLFFELYLLRGQEASPIPFEEVLEDPARKAAKLRAAFPNIYDDFQRYMREWGLPYTLSAPLESVESLLKKVVVEDVPAMAEMKSSSIPKLERLLMALALSPPGEASYEALSSAVGLSKSTVQEFLYLLERAHVLRLLPPYTKRALPAVRRKKKVLFTHPMLRHALLKPIGREMVGSYREEAAALHLSQVGALHYLNAPKEPDFVLVRGNKEWVFEIGRHRHGKGGISVEDREKAPFPLYLLGFLKPEV